MSWGVALRNAVGLGLGGIPSLLNAALYPRVDFNFLSGQLDPRITFTRSSTGTYVNSSGVLSSAAVDAPRFDYNPTTLAPLGLLIEEQRTNSIRNNTAQGAVAGTPGTVPTYWSVSFNTTTGITRSIVGTGVEDGISYIDINLVGTASGAGSIDFAFEAANSIAAATGQIWGTSLYWKIAAGSLTGLSNPIFYTYEYDSAVGFVNAPNSGSPALPTTAPLRTQRFRGAATLVGGATTAFVRPVLKLDIAGGAAIDITLRIGMPQLEQGAFATSVIPTTTATVTRAADVASVTGANFSSWFNSAQGTMFVEAQQPVIFAASKTAASFTDGTNNNRFTLYRQAAGGINVFSNPGGVVVSSGLSASAGVSWKSALSYNASPASFSANGITPLSLFYTVNPNLFTELVIGNAFAGGNEYFNGYIRSFKYYPTRLRDSALQALTR